MFGFSKEKTAPQEIEKPLLEHNVQFMLTAMRNLLRKESVGGNASGIEVNGRHYPCAAANGYVDRETGRLVRFGNFQHVDEQIRAENAHIQFRVVVNLRDPGEPYDDSVISWNSSEEFRPEVRQVIEDSVAAYNEALKGL